MKLSPFSGDMSDPEVEFITLEGNHKCIHPGRHRRRGGTGLNLTAITISTQPTVQLCIPPDCPRQRSVLSLQSPPTLPPQASILPSRFIGPSDCMRIRAQLTPQPNISCEASFPSKVNNGLENHLIGIGREAEPYAKIRGNLSRQHHMHGRYDIVLLISHLMRIL